MGRRFERRFVESEPMRVTRIAYAVDGWGVGELWLGDGRIVLAHEAPSPQRSTPPPDPRPTSPSNPHRGATRPPSEPYPANQHTRVTASFRISCEGSTASSRASPSRSRTSSSTWSGARRFSVRSRARFAQSRAARSSPTASWPTLAGYPRAASCRRQLLRAQPVLSARPVPPRRRRRRDRLVRCRSGSATSAASSRLERHAAL